MIDTINFTLPADTLSHHMTIDSQDILWFTFYDTSPHSLTSGGGRPGLLYLKFEFVLLNTFFQAILVLYLYFLVTLLKLELYTVPSIPAPNVTLNHVYEYHTFTWRPQLCENSLIEQRQEYGNVPNMQAAQQLYIHSTKI